MPVPTITGFAAAAVATGRGHVWTHTAGTGPPVLLLHGFPQTSLMWRDVAPRLAGRFTVIAADLPGYGSSDCLPDSADHSAMAKRALAADLVAAMAALGHRRFFVAGHDRGGRVAYRMALDHPATVARLAVLDVVPTLEVWDRADDRLALSFWPFALLAQPAPLPERMIAAAPAAVIDDALANWGTPPTTFPEEVRAAYVAALAHPARIHAICEEYRAAATIDRDHDAADRAASRRIACPLLALWSASGALGQWYQAAGGPLGLWRGWAERAEGEAVAGGHFFPEEYPADTADRLTRFFA